ncbi:MULTISPECIES: ABC transporter permease [unclassified Beijerinckia]|uniref:ABC transporter permease n=1 Tax=unclassified Beijerinckia TaxID=2638183 RepID=UPI000894623A|nr:MULTISPECIES: ABC transporter permease [unclassified Beijerinckia]MDH7797614.1 NitT/TauT family transport system permease protein [Beijerinckia sp. GAS462]SEC92388.1 NitT/TauT family transport system permease protein [Beijerinckia sp. 28-YEA-48]
MSAVSHNDIVSKPPAAARRKPLRESVLPWITTPLLLILLIGIWHFYVAATNLSPFILPAPAKVWDAWIDMLMSPRAWSHTLQTVYVTVVGFLWALVIGVGLGVLLGRSRWLELTLNPFIVATQVIPKVALLPLFIVWFGFGSTPKVIVAAVLAFFPILTNTVLGVKSVDAGHKDVMTSLNASNWQIFRRLELPSSLPYIITGMEVGIVLAIIGAIVGEYLGGNAGLGFMLVSKMNGYETDGLFAVIIQMTLLGFFFYFATGALRRFLIPWHQSVNLK